MCAQHRLFSRICGLMAIANAVWGAPQDLSNDLTHRPVLLSNPSAPTKVFSAVLVNGYGMLDTASSTISIDFYLYLNWRDDRLANRTLTNGYLSDADIKGQKVWLPRTEVYACVTVTECVCVHTVWSGSVVSTYVRCYRWICVGWQKKEEKTGWNTLNNV
jgi:hypothetical protein